MQVGLAAGVATSVLWTGTSLCFTAAGRRIGPVVVNASRILLAIVLLSITHRAMSGTWMPDAQPKQILYLGLSGIVGLSIGDQALFVAFVDIGPRLTLLIMTTSPLFAALFGWMGLGETLDPLAWVGMTLTIGGVAWVVSERTPAGDGSHSSHRTRGVVLALVGAVCQAGGLLLSKQGMGHGWLHEGARLSPQAATLIRMLFAGMGVIPLLALRWRRRVGVQPPRAGGRNAGFAFTALGAFVGPYLGVWMSLVATDRAPLGMAQTLCSLSPIFLLPIVAKFHKERITSRAVLGALLAVAGASLLFVA